MKQTKNKINYPKIFETLSLISLAFPIFYIILYSILKVFFKN